jgi:hypothetical protein
MPDRPFDPAELVADLKERADRERAEGGYPDADELSDLALEEPRSGAHPLLESFDLGGTAPRIRFRPELGFSSKPVVGPVITGVKKLNLRLLFHVFDDLARQTDAAIGRLASALAAEANTREAATTRQEEALRRETEARKVLERDVEALSARIAELEERAKR